ncbi:MAG: cytochrome b/b6 [Alphaproteobacteria bacterium]
MSGHTSATPKSGLIGWIDSRLPVFSYLEKEYRQFPAPRNFNYFWNFGAIATVMLVTMIATGIVLAMQYTPHVDMAFNSVERIMRDVNNGWLLRYLHMNGASFFFIAVYIHILRGLWYGSYKQPRELLWILGVVILLLMMATAFMGYVLPWGQMSFWGAKVITNLFSAIPLVGEDITTWLWGGFTVDNPTLNRFFSLHYLLPFVIVGVVGLHVVALHVVGSNNPLGIDPKGPRDTLPFHPYYTAKDSFGIVVFLIVYALFVFFLPNYMGHPDNYIPANPLSTPAHIVPEWYFLPFYAILRSIDFDIWFIPAKLGGVIAMFGSILVLALAPWLDKSPVRSCKFRPVYRWFVLILVADVILLGLVGAKVPDDEVFAGLGITWLDVGHITTFWYFIHFLIVMPLVGKMERPLPLPLSIRDAVLKGGGGMPAGAAAQTSHKA